MEIKRTLVVDSAEFLSKALPQLDESPAVIVTRNGSYLGMIDHMSVSGGIKNPHNVKCETVICKPPVLLETAGVMERVDAFLVGHFKALPVLGPKKSPLGITTRVELLSDMLGSNLVPNLSVKELMSSPVYTIDENESIGSAKRLMKDKKAHRLVVTRKGKIIGVVSNYDIGSWSGTTNLIGGRKDIRQSEPINVDLMGISSFLRPDMTLVNQDATLEFAVKRMIAKHVSSVIVVSDNKPIGVISALDIFKLVQSQAEEGVAINVSGLGEDNASYYNRVQEKLGRVLERFGESFNIRNASFHLKETKSTFNVRMYFDTDDGHVSVKVE
ncbi:MAG: CBS domain-containing protein, partial [Candidatus Micrarchaeota archaeon]